MYQRSDAFDPHTAATNIRLGSKIVRKVIVVQQYKYLVYCHAVLEIGHYIVVYDNYR
jgi:hypothetical protein